MKRILSIIGFTLALCGWTEPCFAADPAPVEPVLTDASAKGFVGFVFSSEKLKEMIDDKLDGFQYVTMGVGFLLLVFPSINGLIRRGLNPETISRYVTKPILLCGFIAITPEIQVVMSAGCDGLAAVMGYSPVATIDSYYAETRVFDLKGAASALRADSAVLTETTILDKMGSTLMAIRDLSRWFVQAAISVPTALLLGLLSFVTMMSMYVAELLRHLLLSVGYALLPVFLAGFNSELFQRSAYRYAMRMVSLHLWPLAWSLIGALTLVLVHLIRIYVDSLFATAAIDPAGEFGLVELIAVTPTVVVLALVLTMLVVTTGHLYGVIKAPALLTKLVADGGTFVEGMIDQAKPPAPQATTVTLSSTSSGVISAVASSGTATTSGGPLSQGSISSSGGPVSRSPGSAAAMSEVFGEAGQRALVLARNR